MAQLTHTALGAWSRRALPAFRRADRRASGSSRCCGPGGGIDTVVTADAYGAGAADELVGPRAQRAAARLLLRSSARSATTSTRASARARRATRASPTRGCAARTPTRDYLRMATERSLERCGVDRFDLLLLHNPDRTGFTSEAVWDGLRAVRDDGPDRHARRRARARPTASRSTSSTASSASATDDRLGDGDPQPVRALARRARARGRRRARRQAAHPRRRLRRPVPRRRRARARVRPARPPHVPARRLGRARLGASSSACARSPSATASRRCSSPASGTSRTRRCAASCRR